MSDEEIDDEPAQIHPEKGAGKKSLLPFKNGGAKTDKADNKASESQVNVANTSGYPGQSSSHGIIAGQTGGMAYTGLTALMHLTRIPDKLMIDAKPSRREKNEINLIKRMINSYFDVVKKNVNDLVPKAIITFFIKKTIDLAEKEMVHNLYDEKLIETIMREDQDIVTQRKAVQANVDLLKECLVLMAEFEHTR
jgi:hypothetical protein